MKPGQSNAHHLVHWLDGGPTDIHNAALLCRAHHTVVHRERYAGAVIQGPHGPQVHWDLATAPTTRNWHNSVRPSARQTLALHDHDPAPHPPVTAGPQACQSAGDRAQPHEQVETRVRIGQASGRATSMLRERHQSRPTQVRPKARAPAAPRPWLPSVSAPSQRAQSAGRGSAGRGAHHELGPKDVLRPGRRFPGDLVEWLVIVRFSAGGWQTVAGARRSSSPSAGSRASG